MLASFLTSVGGRRWTSAGCGLSTWPSAREAREEGSGCRWRSRPSAVFRGEGGGLAPAAPSPDPSTTSISAGTPFPPELGPKARGRRVRPRAGGCQSALSPQAWRRRRRSALGRSLGAIGGRGRREAGPASTTRRLADAGPLWETPRWSDVGGRGLRGGPRGGKGPAHLG